MKCQIHGVSGDHMESLDFYPHLRVVRCPTPCMAGWHQRKSSGEFGFLLPPNQYHGRLHGEQKQGTHVPLNQHGISRDLVEALNNHSTPQYVRDFPSPGYKWKLSKEPRLPLSCVSKEIHPSSPLEHGRKSLL